MVEKMNNGITKKELSAALVHPEELFVIGAAACTCFTQHIASIGGRERKRSLTENSFKKKGHPEARIFYDFRCA